MTKKYQIIYADPPWKGDQTAIAKKSWISGGHEQHYPAMETLEICSLPIREISDENSILFLWVRSPMLQQGLDVGKAWGFSFRTIAFIWYKQAINPGAYTLSECEIVLLFKRGKIPDNRGARNVRQFLSEKRTIHSKKPEEIRKRIDQMFPTQNKIELFARQKTEGWDVWGNEVECTAELGSAV